MFVVIVDTETCEGCEECVIICPERVFEMNNTGKADPVNSAGCTDCESCLGVCPTDAITIVEV